MKSVLDGWRVLTEGRFEDAKKKFPDIADKLDYFKGVPDKYILWIAKTIKNTLASNEKDLQEIKDVVLKFDGLVNANKIQKKDINQWDIIALHKAIEDIGIGPSNTLIKKQAKGEAKIIYKDERFTVIQPLSKAASCQYGRGTKWCISATNSRNYWSYYNHSTKDHIGNPLDGEYENTPDEELYDFDKPTNIKFFFILDKTPARNNWEKVAVAAHASLTETEIFDATDDPVKLSDFQGYYPEPVLQAISNASGNNGLLGVGMSIKSIIQDSQNASLTDRQFRSKLEGIYNTISNTQLEEDTGQYYEQLVLGVATRFLPLLYNLSGTNRYPYTLRNAGVQGEFEQRLEQLSVNDVLACANKSYEAYSVNEQDEYWREGDPYFEWFDGTKRQFTMEELKKVAKFVPTYFNDPPFEGFAEEQYLKMIAPSLGVPVTYADMGVKSNSTSGVFIVLRAYAKSINTRNTLNALAEKVKENDQAQVNFLMKRIISGWSVDPGDVMAIVNLINQGKLNYKILEPLLTEV